jgi:Tfp pilus assembly protein PilF
MERIEKLKEFLLRDPEDSFLQHALALEYIKIGMDREAKERFEKILSKDPGYIGSYYHLAKLLEKMGVPDSAMQWYEKGMAAAKAAGDTHAYAELKAALDELTG